MGSRLLRTQNVPPDKPKPPTDDPRYNPTVAELNEDMRIPATPKELAAAIFGWRETH